MITRKIVGELQVLLNEYPVVTILGPRQAGKTTLAREQLVGYEYSNLEIPETRELATADPVAYLEQFQGKVIIDEIQRVPHLLSYIQAIVDDENESGRYVLTGSHQLQLREAITQSLAGRTAILNLLPFSIDELKNVGIEFSSFEEYCFTGFLPRIYDKKLRPGVAYSNYYQTYVERDVRQLINLKDAALFEKFLKLVAGRAGQIMDFSSLSNAVGVSVKTIQAWLSIMEASFILFKLPPYFDNFGKRTVKSPKYYFTDVGLLSFLLGIREKEQVTRDPLVGSIFENLVVLEFLKSRYNRGMMSDLYYFRDSNGNEVDLVFQDGGELVAVEIKSAKTFAMDHLKGLKRFQKIVPRLKGAYLVNNGEAHTLSDGMRSMNYKDIDDVFA
jgi:predicted AAA+ superfamily ATPase